MKKKISTLMTILLSLFALYSIIWFANSELVFSKYMTEDFEKTPVSSFNSRVKEVEGYFLNVKKPDYGSFTGNLSIASPYSNITMIIWPSLFNDPTYGLIIQDGKEVFQIEVDKSFSPLDKNNTTGQQIIEEYWGEIQKQKHILQEHWGLFEDDIDHAEN